MSQSMPAAVSELPFAEKLRLVEALWDDLASSPDRIPVPDKVKAELDRRYQEYLVSPDEGSSWKDVKLRLPGGE